MVVEKIRIKQATKKGYIECENGGVFDSSYPTSDKRRGRVQHGGVGITNHNNKRRLHYED